MKKLLFQKTQNSIYWSGVELHNGTELSSFLNKDVASRLHDEEGKVEFEAQLNSIASTGFEQESLKEILDAEYPEERDWAVGEALAEAWLSREYGILWAWNMERDKRTPKASLPGADLIGFIVQGEEVYLVIGEVKTSSDKKTPPHVMVGRSGMTHQLEKLVTDISLLSHILRWLQPRCKDRKTETYYKAACKQLLSSGNKAMTLFGVLIRDTQPSEKDLLNRARYLDSVIKNPTVCQLLAIYLPFNISDLPNYIQTSSTS